MKQVSLSFNAKKSGSFQAAPLRSFAHRTSHYDQIVVVRDREHIDRIAKARLNVNRSSDDAVALDAEIDRSAIHLAALGAHEEIVGAMRLVENPRDSQCLLEHGRLYGVRTFPVGCLNQGVVEIGRAWVGEAHRGSGLFVAMIRRAVEHCLRRRVRYVVLSAGSQLQSLYRRLGCVPYQTFETPDHKEWTLYLYDLFHLNNPAAFLLGAAPSMGLQL
jgi:predicted GNAT family N-acyltransferase